MLSLFGSWGDGSLVVTFNIVCFVGDALALLIHVTFDSRGMLFLCEGDAGLIQCRLCSGAFRGGGWLLGDLLSRSAWRLVGDGGNDGVIDLVDADVCGAKLLVERLDALK